MYRLKEPSGSIVDSPLDYEKWKSCTWIIDSERYIQAVGFNKKLQDIQSL